MPYLFHSDLISLLCGSVFALIKKKLNECVYGIVGKSAGDATIARAHHTRARARLFLTISRVRCVFV